MQRTAMQSDQSAERNEHKKAKEGATLKNKKRERGVIIIRNKQKKKKKKLDGCFLAQRSPWSSPFTDDVKVSG
ncbi:hypothetical protein D9C73_016635 [Collichthys lucidus]|uniref:Uncharacterized protein n=1 Tax=Collichthys lucidus TaxID=240159 RepID=A0A4U5V3Z8_COLLU|nr:hypothetical protein D9C73_016635 [Collichthys lucidus]